MSINADTLALAVMDDDGHGCAITGMPAVNAYEAAMDRMEAARRRYREARREAERILREAGAEFEAAEDDLIRYETKRGIPLPEYRTIRPGKSAYIHPGDMSRGMGAPGVLVDNDTDASVTVAITREGE